MPFVVEHKPLTNPASGAYFSLAHASEMLLHPCPQVSLYNISQQTAFSIPRGAQVPSIYPISLVYVIESLIMHQQRISK